MKQDKKVKQDTKIAISILALVVILIGGILVAGMMSGWFDDPKVVLSQEYYSKNPKFIDLSADKYEELIKSKKSFVILVDQNGCTTADRVRKYVTNYMTEKGVDIYKMMFKEVKSSSLNDYVKYYPSVVIVSNGRVRAYLRADKDADADAYNDYSAFTSWINQYF